MKTVYQSLVNQINLKQQQIDLALKDYWENDIWECSHPNFDKYYKSRLDKTHRTIDFSYFSEELKKEVKYFILCRLENDDAKLRNTIVKTYAQSFKHVSVFLNKYYPNINSITELDIFKAQMKLKTYLIEKGIHVHKDSTHTRFEILVNRLYDFYADFYDIRNEFDKDIWDIRKIPGVRVLDHTSHYNLNFTNVPKAFLDVVKRYIKYRISIISTGRCSSDIRAIRLFLNYIHEKYPMWIDLSLLSRKDIEDYIIWYRKATEKTKKAAENYLIPLNVFLSTIERNQYPEAPKAPTALLMFREDFPRKQKPSENSIKYIPEEVLQQLEDKLEYLTPQKYIPIVVLLRASGWRISDVLYLKYDSCLEKIDQGWYLCGDIQKTQVLNHRIPITDEIALIVKSLIETIKANSNETNNPKKFLFGCLEGQRKGRLPASNLISRALNKLAVKHRITDAQGNIFHFKNHAFRHTKGVELINNGMNILHVQKWLAHSSPEMTLCYARILDTTMRKSWEEATKQGLFRIVENGIIKKINISEIENEDIIEWEYIRHNLDAVRMPLGYCMKPKKQECHTQLNPCLTCRNLCTTPDFITQYELEIQETQAVIKCGKSQNRNVWVEKNQALLERYEAILTVLKEGKTHHMAGKKGREYVGEERNNG
jgi:integrase